MNQATTEAPVAAAKKVYKPAAPAKGLFLKVGDRSLPIVRYPFPIKFNAISLVVNGVKCEAATTKGKDFPYTYFYIDNTSLSVMEHLADGTECTFTPPDGFKYDAERKPRVSNYKKKVKTTEATEAPATTETEAQAVAEDAGHAAAEATVETVAQESAPVAARRRR